MPKTCGNRGDVMDRSMTPLSEKKPWDTDCQATKVALERFVRSLVMVGGHFTDSFFLPTGEVARPNRYTSVFFRVWIPVGQEERFKELSKMKLAPPPRLQVN